MGAFVNKFKPRPLSRILARVRGYFQTFRRPPPVLFIWELPPPGLSHSEPHFVKEVFFTLSIFLYASIETIVGPVTKR